MRWEVFGPLTSAASESFYCFNVVSEEKPELSSEAFDIEKIGGDVMGMTLEYFTSQKKY